MAKNTEKFLEGIEKDLRTKFSEEFFKEIRLLFQSYEDSLREKHDGMLFQFERDEEARKYIQNLFLNFCREKRVHYLGVIERQIKSKIDAVCAENAKVLDRTSPALPAKADRDE